MDEAKPFSISKREVLVAFKRVKANRGAAGVDRQSIADFEANLAGNLYKLWNRMSSGSYFPPPVRRVDIPKANGGTRSLGIPTVADRVAQEVVRRHLEPILEPVFHADSYGYRPGKSAIDAVAQARERCWRYDWVLDLDIKGFWELMLKAVRRHTDCPWALLYIERWLRSPVQMEDGRIVVRTAGTPQGGVISPLLANLFLHYAFDMWMAREFPHIPFERYADDAICHCRTEAEVRALWQALESRMADCKLMLHPEKTKIVYCKDANRRGDFPDIRFDFLGFQFRARKTMWTVKGRRIFTHGGSWPRKEIAVKKYIVRLSADERAQLNDLVRKGKRSAQLLTKARILLKADVSEGGEGWSDRRIAEALDTSIANILRTRRQLVEEGFEAVLTRKYNPNSARPRIFDGVAEAKLITLACGPAPEGHAKWTLRLLEDKVVELHIVERASDNTIGRTLKKTLSSRI